MKVILKEDIATLGKAGDLVEVARGYGRNFLIPQGKALEASRTPPKTVGGAETDHSEKKGQRPGGCPKSGRTIWDLDPGIIAQGGGRRKSIRVGLDQDLMEKLAEKNISLDRKKILLKDPIRTLGDFEVPIKLDSEVTATLKVSVVEKK